ncbi:thymidine kinase 2, mitochondrial-like isoform X2 [Dreissena polymorpha]|uniref:thymidine kinase 2, mitochondrial-like isoform X2 n=1 Tax=Dreissena polymorpha TaxID=45954 RepID=UPI002263F709|nr:thymidine kinase 2, mitochondrial-like isoform X2 [Dreissena polymorpha]
MLSVKGLSLENVQPTQKRQPRVKKPYTEMMYKDASRWSLAFQSYVQLTMADVHRKDTQRPVKMIERSLYSARYCFVENLYQGGLMPEVDYAILSEWYNWIQDNEDMHIDLIVYLQALPVTCQERIKMRNRHEEQSVPLDYLESLNDLHENWLIKQTKFKTPCPVLVINADCGLDDMYKKFDLHREEILRLNKEN